MALKLRKWDVTEHMDSENGNPEFATIQKLITALGLQMSIIAPVKSARSIGKRQKQIN